MEEIQRTFKCKDEELPVLANYVDYSINRDIADFTAFSPVFTPEYITGYQAKITAVNAVVAPETETVVLKTFTLRLNATMDGLIPKLKDLEAYLQLAKPNLGIAPADFGIRNLRKAINNGDAEGVINGLNILNAHIETWGAPLVAVGFTEDKAAELTAAAVSINADNQAQYEIVSQRKQIVQENIGIFNELWSQFSDILRVGKALYRNTNPVKYEEYTYAKLLRKVRQVAA